MSTDFSALFDRGCREATADWLRDKLAANPPELAEVVACYRDRWRVQSWHVDREGVRSELLGPSGFVLRYRSQTIELYHMMPFSHFAGDARARHMLRSACAFVAEALGSDTAIYTHELMPYDGDSLEEIGRGLRARIGPPAATLGDLHSAEPFGPRAWYIDTFTDLRSVGE